MLRRSLLAASTLSLAAIGVIALLKQDGRAQAETAIAAVTDKITPYATTIPASQRKSWFGELHLHTTMSFDAWTFGTTTTPDQAYKFGEGQKIEVLGKTLQRAWPLDFMAVTDHSEAMGVMNQLDDPTTAFAQSDAGKQIIKNRPSAFYLIAAARAGGAKAPAALNIAGATKSAWDVEQKAANDNYRPGSFTTFIAYEWSSLAENKYNLHRNVIFNADHAPMPFTAQQSPRPEDLWTYLESVRARGIDVLAIPHNGNVSSGLMYDWNDSNGKPIDEAYAERRMLNEPLNEIVQNKGQSDTLPELSPSDEFANFEIFDHLITWPNIKGKSPGSYIRDAYGRGLVIDSKVGANPYKFGVVGASDIHNGISASGEENMAGAVFGIDPRTTMPHGAQAKIQLDITKTNALIDMDATVNAAKPTPENNLIFSSAGITGVWAEENTRDSIFAALKRKETWATSGTRIKLRVFAGWNFNADILANGNWTSIGYRDGVPMGSDLPAAPATGGSPKLVLWAVKDPDGANLDRIQVIKVWLDGGAYKEKVFDAVWSGTRKLAKDGKLPAVGNSVNLKTSAYKNSIGATELSTVWSDPEFDGKTPAVYYVRVLEIPTPRWSTLLAVKNHLPIPKSVPATIQERAWSSPVWYTPKG